MPYQANEATTTEFEIRVYHLLDSCLTRLMMLSPQDFKIGVYLLLDSYLTRLTRLSPQDETTTIGKRARDGKKRTNNQNDEENRKMNYNDMERLINHSMNLYNGKNIQRHCVINNPKIKQKVQT